MQRTPCHLAAMAALASALMLAPGCSSDEYDVDAPTTAIMDGQDWRDQIIYQLVVDRFADGDINNNWGVEYGTLGRYQGGDWQGVIDHLDYLQALGVTTLWVSPVVRNIDFDAGFDGYHGYWTQDPRQANPHFGSPAKLREMVDKAHAVGMKVILDLVTNHMGQLFYYDINDNGEPDTIFTGSTIDQNAEALAQLHRNDEYDPDFNPAGIQGQNGLGPSGPSIIRFLYMPEINRVPPAPIKFGPQDADVLDFTRPGVFNRHGRTTNYDNVDELVTGDFPGGLKDLDTRRQDVRRGLALAYAEWIRKADFDGFRIDTLKHVEHEFWQDFGPSIRKYVHGEAPIYGVPPLSVPKKNWYMFGEAFDGDDALLGEFTYNSEIDGVFYFSQKFQVYGDVVKCSGPTKEAEDLWNDRLRFNPAAARVHGATRTCNEGRCFRSTSKNNGGGPVPDPVAGQPIYNQQGIPDGPVDTMGQPIPPSKLLVSFLDNHDVSRYLSPITGCYTDADSAKKQLHNALGLMFTQDGIPCVYYGTEQEYAGGNDPANRERLFDTVLDNVYLGASTSEREPLGASGYDTTNATFQWIAHLARVRKAYDTLRRGDLAVTWSTMHTGNEEDAGILAFTRSYEGHVALVVTNVNNGQISDTGFMGAAMTVPFPVGTKLVDVLKDPLDMTGEDSYTVQAGGQVVVRVSPRATRVLVPEGDAVTVK